MANTSRNSMYTKLSRLLAVTLLTPNRMVLSSLPWLVLNPVRSTNPIQPLSGTRSCEDCLSGGMCCTTRVPPLMTCRRASRLRSRISSGVEGSRGSSSGGLILRQHGFVHNAGGVQEEDVTGDHVGLFGATWGGERVNGVMT